jgi:hypothetical protein
MITAIYNINWRSFIGNNLPIDLRQPKMINWLEVLLKPLASLHTAFLAYRLDALYKASQNSQVCYLEKILRDRFGFGSLVFIRNAKLNEPIWFYEIKDNKPIYFYDIAANKPVYFREETALQGDGIDFIVFLHSDIWPVDYGNGETVAWLAQMAALIDYYKLCSKTYRFQIYYT